jgi:hypothetical protein
MDQVALCGHVLVCVATEHSIVNAVAEATGIGVVTAS